MSQGTACCDSAPYTHKPVSSYPMPQTRPCDHGRLTASHDVRAQLQKQPSHAAKNSTDTEYNQLVKVNLVLVSNHLPPPSWYEALNLSRVGVGADHLFVHAGHPQLRLVLKAAAGSSRQGADTLVKILPGGFAIFVCWQLLRSHPTVGVEFWFGQMVLTG